MVKRNNRPRMKRSLNALRRAKKNQHTANRSVPAEFYHKTIESAWDLHKTLQQNYTHLGLAADPNAKTTLRSNAQQLTQYDVDLDEKQLAQQIEEEEKKREEEEEQQQQAEEGDGESGGQLKKKKKKSKSTLTPAARAVQAELSAIQELTSRPIPSYQIQSMSVAEQRRIAALLEKYGDDVAAMARDIKINVMQQTEGQLRKRVALYKRLQTL